MGKYVRAKIVVGLPLENIHCLLDKDYDYDPEVYEEMMLFEKDLFVSHGYYDSSETSDILGITVASSEDYMHSEIDNEVGLLLEIKKAKFKFKEALGLEPKVYITPDIY